MKPLHAPWRMEFVEGRREKGCVLCKMGGFKKNAASFSKHHVVERLEHTYVVMNKYPYSNAHIMICPVRHLNLWTELTAEELSEIGVLSQKALRALTKAFRPDGFNIGVNLGKAAGAGIADHVHQHIVPRWLGDFNFLPLFGEVKVISEHLEATYRRLLKAWGEVK